MINKMKVLIHGSSASSNIAVNYKRLSIKRNCRPGGVWIRVILLDWETQDPLKSSERHKDKNSSWALILLTTSNPRHANCWINTKSRGLRRVWWMLKYWLKSSQVRLCFWRRKGRCSQWIYDRNDKSANLLEWLRKTKSKRQWNCPRWNLLKCRTLQMKNYKASLLKLNWTANLGIARHRGSKSLWRLKRKSTSL